jgi:hypothetical protein
VFNHCGDLERCLLWPGNAHGAEDWRLVLEPVVGRYRKRGVALYFRADAAFAKPDCWRPRVDDTAGGQTRRCSGGLGTCGRGRAAAAQDADPLPRQLPLLALRVRETRSRWWPSSSGTRANFVPASARS